MYLLALLHRRANDSERGPISRCSERTRVAVREHSAGTRHQRGAVTSHRLVRRDVLRVHALSFFDQLSLDLRNGPDADALVFLLHSPYRPEQIHRSRPRFADQIADLVEVALEVAGRFSFGIVHTQRNAHGRSHADRRRPTHHHVANHICHLLMRLAGHINFFGRQLRLIDEAHTVVSPFQGLDHKFVVGSYRKLKAYAPRSGCVDYSSLPGVRTLRKPPPRHKRWARCHRSAEYVLCARRSR